MIKIILNKRGMGNSNAFKIETFSLNVYLKSGEGKGASRGPRLSSGSTSGGRESISRGRKLKLSC